MPESVVIDRDICMGSGMCVVYAPATFAQDDETKAMVREPGDDPGADDPAAIRTAVEACPTGALAFEIDQREV